MVARADWICVMTSEQADAVAECFQSTVPVVSLGSFSSPLLEHTDATARNADALKEIAAFQKLLGQTSLAAEATNIIDPFGGSLEAYRSCAEKIRRSVQNMARLLIDHAA
ncbi:MAG: hypothetical protein JWN98_1074 [Abditibacteriota bacterium]|nr:hypothetical protein [Abditibacteriota bacterium]